MQYISSSRPWQKFWGICFGDASLIIVVLFSLVLGNSATGVPINKDGIFRSGFAQSLNLKAGWAAIAGAALITMHGAVYAAIKSPMQLRDNIIKWAFGAWVLTVLAPPAVILKIYNYRVDDDNAHPVLFACFAFLIFVSLTAVPWLLRRGKYFSAFIASSLLIASLLGFFAVQLFPRIIVSSVNDSYSLTIYNASATATPVKIMLIIVGIGIPAVIAYGAYAYWVLEHKIKEIDGY